MIVSDNSINFIVLNFKTNTLIAMLTEDKITEKSLE